MTLSRSSSISADSALEALGALTRHEYFRHETALSLMTASDLIHTDRETAIIKLSGGSARYYEWALSDVLAYDVKGEAKKAACEVLVFIMETPAVRRSLPYDVCLKIKDVVKGCEDKAEHIMWACCWIVVRLLISDTQLSTQVQEELGGPEMTVRFLSQLERGRGLDDCLVDVVVKLARKIIPSASVRVELEEDGRAGHDQVVRYIRSYVEFILSRLLYVREDVTLLDSLSFLLDHPTELSKVQCEVGELFEKLRESLEMTGQVQAALLDVIRWTRNVQDTTLPGATRTVLQCLLRALEEDGELLKSGVEILEVLAPRVPPGDMDLVISIFSCLVSCSSSPPNRRYPSGHLNDLQHHLVKFIFKLPHSCGALGQTALRQFLRQYILSSSGPALLVGLIQGYRGPGLQGLADYLLDPNIVEHLTRHKVITWGFPLLQLLQPYAADSGTKTSIHEGLAALVLRCLSGPLREVPPDLREVVQWCLSVVPLDTMVPVEGPLDVLALLEWEAGPLVLQFLMCHNPPGLVLGPAASCPRVARALMSKKTTGMIPLESVLLMLAAALTDEVVEVVEVADMMLRLLQPSSDPLITHCQLRILKKLSCVRTVEVSKHPVLSEAEGRLTTEEVDQLHVPMSQELTPTIQALAKNLLGTCYVTLYDQQRLLFDIHRQLVAGFKRIMSKSHDHWHHQLYGILKDAMF